MFYIYICLSWKQFQQTDALESCENDVIECFDRTADRETFGRVKKFQRSLQVGFQLEYHLTFFVFQTFLNGCTLKNIEGIVVTKSVPLKTCIIYVNDCLISFEWSRFFKVLSFNCFTLKMYKCLSKQTSSCLFLFFTMFLLWSQPPDNPVLFKWFMAKSQK